MAERMQMKSQREVELVYSTLTECLLYLAFYRQRSLITESTITHPAHT